MQNRKMEAPGASEKPVYPPGLKWTKQRKAVYDVLCGTKEPLTAAELYDSVKRRNPGEEYALSTIYRILSVMEEHQLLEKEVSMEGGTAAYALCRGEHIHYAICIECRRRIPLKKCPFVRIPLQEDSDFTVTNHRIELYGYCKECKNVKPCP